MKILTITSGKGGVGKTTIGLNIARQLSLHGVRVLVADFDIHNKGATGLFLDRVSDSSPSVMRTVHESNHFDRQQAADLARATEPLLLDEKGTLLFLPASTPKEMVKWSRFVADNSQIVTFFGAFFGALAERCSVDVVLIDCYGGVDSLTVAAAGLAHDTIIVNEPDLITFSGTLLLYNYLADTYKDSEIKPRVSFVINRITSRHSFDFLTTAYQKNLIPLAVNRSILAFFPYDKLLMETFGDYPYFSELLPSSLYTKKILLLIETVWPEKPFNGMLRASERRKRKIYRTTVEAPFADPERIMRGTVIAPLWLALPVTLLIMLAQGAGGSLSFAAIRNAYVFALLLIACIVFFIGGFEPLQITRWWVRVANFRRRKRWLEGVKNPAYRKLRAFVDYGLALLPITFGIAFLAVVSFYLSNDVLDPYHFSLRDIRIWPREVTGFAPYGHYDGLMMRPGASIRPGTDMSHSSLRKADLAGVIMRSVKLAGRDVDVTGADFDGADMARSDFSGVRFNNSNLRGARFDGANLTGTVWNQRPDLSARFFSLDPFANPGPPAHELPGAVLIGSDLTNASLYGSDMAGADLTDSRMNQAALANSDLSWAVARRTHWARATLTLCDLSYAVLENVDVTGARWDGANFHGADLRLIGPNVSVRLLSYAKASGGVLSADQEAQVSEWQRNNPVLATWPKSPNQEARERLKGVLAYPIGPNQDLRSRQNRTELLILANEWTQAENLLAGLDGGGERDAGVKLLLLLELAVMRGSDDAAAGNQWCDWLNRHPRLDDWFWNAWNPIAAYSLPDQSEKMRDIELSAKGALYSEALRGRYFSRKKGS